jgi:hypothetical protein
MHGATIKISKYMYHLLLNVGNLSDPIEAISEIIMIFIKKNVFVNKINVLFRVTDSFPL